jgi:hypothetical protein
MKKLIGLLCGGLIVCAIAMTAQASPAIGVTPTLLARGTYEGFKVKSNRSAPFEFEAEAKCSSPWSRAF